MQSKYKRLISDAQLYLKQQESHFFLNHLDPKTFSAPLPLPKKKIVQPVTLPPVIQEKKAPPLEPKKPAPIAEVKPPTEKINLKLEAPKVKSDHLEDVKKEILKLSPKLAIHDEPLSDHDAKRIATSYKYKNQAAPITILGFDDKREVTQFLSEVSSAIATYFDPCKLIDAQVIEKEKRWDAFLAAPELKLIIAPDYAIFEQKALMAFYREIPQKLECYLGNIPLFLLPDLSLYFKDPGLKCSLWKAISKKIEYLK